MKKIFAVLAALLLLVLMACSGGGDDGGDTTKPKTFSIIGQITFNSTALAGVIVSLSGTSTAQTITDSSGNYSFSGAANGNYTITASKSDYTFSLPISITVSSANITGQNFTATAVPSSAKVITSFSLNGVIGTINETAKTIAVTMPFSTPVINLVAIFTTTGISVKVGSIVQTSGMTSNNFTSPVTYTVTAADATTQDYSVTVTTVVYQPGDIVRTLPFPAGISGVSDVVFDSASQAFLLFAYDVLSNWKVTKIIQIDYLSGATLSTTTIVNPDFFMNHASEFVKAGDYYYGTSYGWSNGVPQSLIYKIDLNGNIVSTFPCPATSTGGFCEGLAWDGQYLWSGASDNKNLTQFSINGTVYATLTVLDSIGSHDVSYDKTAQQLIVSLDNSLNRYNPVTGAEINNVYTGFSRVGDWDGNFFWAINSSTQQLEGIYIGN